MSGVIRTVPCGCESGQPCTPATRCAITTAVHIQREDDEAEMERLREDHEAELAALRAELECGHPASLMVHSAETGEPLYCELCDMRSQRNDAVQMEEHYKAELTALRERVARLVGALEWYAQMAKHMGAACLHQDSQRMLHLMKELSVDYGKRARTALEGK